jgi:hypothetical protein
MSTVENRLAILGLIVLAGCADSPAPASPNDTPADPFVVVATVPGFVSEKDFYPLIGSASHPATGWTWERSRNGGAFQFWAAAQNTRFVAYAGEHNFQWRLTAKRIGDEVTATDVQTTVVCVGSGCSASGLRLAGDQVRGRELTRPGGR